MWLWTLLLFFNIWALIVNIQAGSAIWAGISALGIVFCLKNLIPVKQ